MVSSTLLLAHFAELNKVACKVSGPGCTLTSLFVAGCALGFIAGLIHIVGVPVLVSLIHLFAHNLHFIF